MNNNNLNNNNNSAHEIWKPIPINLNVPNSLNNNPI